MIDLTPLDVRKKRGDFKKTLRGYDALEVDAFLELAAERMEELVKANLTLEERAQRLGEQVVALGGRERAVNEALVTAQQLRDEIRDQAQRESEQIRREAERESEQLLKEAEREAEHLAKEARLEAKNLVAESERQLEERQAALAEIESERVRFLESYRQMLQRQIELVQVESNRSPLDEVAVELDLGGGRDRGGREAQRRASFTFADGEASDREATRETAGEAVESEAVESEAADEESDTLAAGGAGLAPAVFVLDRGGEPDEDGGEGGSESDAASDTDPSLEEREAAARALFADEVERVQAPEHGASSADPTTADRNTADQPHADRTTADHPRADRTTPDHSHVDPPPTDRTTADPTRETASSSPGAAADEAIPVEGLAPSADEVEHEATILPPPRVGT